MEASKKIDKQIELELAASAVYKKMGVATDKEDLRTLWNTLAVHEEYHAAALKRLKSTLDPDQLEEEASTLDIKTINSLLENHEGFLDEIPGGISDKRAFEIALFMEFSELNSLFFNAANKEESDSSPYIHSMGEGTKSHLQTLYRAMKNHLNEKEQLEYKERFRELGIQNGD